MANPKIRYSQMLRHCVLKVKNHRYFANGEKPLVLPMLTKDNKRAYKVQLSTSKAELIAREEYNGLNVVFIIDIGIKANDIDDLFHDLRVPMVLKDRYDITEALADLLQVGSVEHLRSVNHFNALFDVFNVA